MTIRQLAAVLFIAAVTVVQAGAQTSAARLTGLDAYIEQAMADWQVPGLAIAVVHGGEVLYSKGFGVRQAGKPERVDVDTVFAFSSNGKAFTATAVAALIDEGLLEWDSRASEYLDHFVLPDPWVSRVVTIRDLLSHRVSGDLGIGKLELWAFTDLERDEVLSRLRYLEVGEPRFRSRFQYSNPNISAAGEVAGVAAGTSWEAVMQARVLDAIDMASATKSVRELWNAGDYAACYMCALDHTPGHEEARIDNIAMPHIATAEGAEVIPWRTVDNIGPAGSINGSVLDFAKFMRLHLGAGEFDGRRVLKARTVQEMHTPQMLVDLPPYPAGKGFGETWSYGLGWYVTEYNGRKTVMHTGGITGWRSAIVMLPGEELGVAVVSNQHGAHLPNALAPALAFVVFDRILDLPRTDRSGEWLASVQASLAQGRAAEDALAGRRQEARGAGGLDARLGGTYEHPAFGKLVVDPSARRVRLADVMEGELEHWHDDVYRVTWIGPWPISYFLNVDGGPERPAAAIDLHGFGRFTRRD